MQYGPANSLAAGRRILATDAIETYSLHRTKLARELIARNPVISLWLILGDVEVADLELTYSASTSPRGGLIRPGTSTVHGILITGNLLVDGVVHTPPAAPDQLALYVLGNLQAKSLAVGNTELVVRGRASCSEVAWGWGAGDAWFHRDLTARVLISQGLSVWVAGRMTGNILNLPAAKVAVKGPQGLESVVGDSLPGQLLLPSALTGPAADPATTVNPVGLYQALISGQPVIDENVSTGEVDVMRLRQQRWYLEEAERSMADEEPRAAARLWRTARDLGPVEPEVLFDLAEAVVLSESGRSNSDHLTDVMSLLDEAIGQELTPQLQTSARYARALMQRAQHQLHLSEGPEHGFQRSWSDLDAALKIIPGLSEVQSEHLMPLVAQTYAVMGHWLLENRRYEDATTYLQQALDMDPGIPGVSADMARCLWFLDRDAQAVAMATAALEQDPGDEFLLYVRGRCHQKLSAFADAVRDLTAYLRQHPDDEYASMALIESLLDAREFQRAEDIARQFCSAFPTASVLARAGRTFLHREQSQLAVELLSQAMELDEDPSLLSSLSLALLDTNGDDRGLQAAVRAFEMGGEAHDTWLRGECWRLLGKNAEAQESLQRYLSSGHTPLAARISLVRVAWAQGREDRAKAWLRQLDVPDHADDPYLQQAMYEVFQSNVATTSEAGDSNAAD